MARFASGRRVLRAEGAFPGRMARFAGGWRVSRTDGAFPGSDGAFSLADGAFSRADSAGAAGAGVNGGSGSSSYHGELPPSHLERLERETTAPGTSREEQRRWRGADAITSRISSPLFFQSSAPCQVERQPASMGICSDSSPTID
ncbi:unnamed protein product [Closterium sp. NIES-64]|nr:unnamed protein product [Closterium sp. NIES-64]